MNDEKYIDDGMSSVLSSLSRRAVETGFPQLVNRALGERIGIDDVRLWKRTRSGDYVLINRVGEGNGIKKAMVPADHPHILRLKSELVVRNTPENHTDMERMLGTGENNIEVALGLDADYIVAFDLKNDPALRERQRGVCRSIGWNVTKALEKDAETKELGRYKRRLESQLDAARVVQRWILPRGQPKFEGFDIYGKCKTAYHVGGDYFDFIEIDKDTLEIPVADVSGKGIASSILTSSVHTALNMKKDVEIEQLMSELNDHLHEHSTPDKFVTMILGRLGKDGSFNYVNAGHDFPVLFNEGGAREIVGDNDFPLGFFSGAKYHKRLAQIERGNVLLLYTDGISEAANREEMFGSGRLKEAVMDSMKLDSVSIARNVFNAMRDYKDCRDDRTLVVIKRCY